MQKVLHNKDLLPLREAITMPRQAKVNIFSSPLTLATRDAEVQSYPGCKRQQQQQLTSRSLKLASCNQVLQLYCVCRSYTCQIAKSVLLGSKKGSSHHHHHSIPCQTLESFVCQLGGNTLLRQELVMRTTKVACIRTCFNIGKSKT